MCLCFNVLKSARLVLNVFVVIQGVVTVGDYDGTLSQLHMETGHFVADQEENDGKR